MRQDWTWKSWAEAIERRDPEALRDLLAIVKHFMTHGDGRRSKTFKLDLGWTEDNNPGEHFVRLQRAAEGAVAEILGAVLRGQRKDERPEFRLPLEQHRDRFVYSEDLRRIHHGLRRRGRPPETQRDADVARYVEMRVRSGLTKTSAIREAGKTFGMYNKTGSTVRAALKRHEERKEGAKKSG